MVDRFLASPTFGERMAWNWLDAARYADSNGYQGDNERTMWPWRDWVVKAYNENMPFDQFSKWQIAGDLLPDATNEQILATAFNRNHPINGEGGRIAEENRVDYVMDMAETAGTVWLGLTFNCCRCHDHKYDQLSQKDYYSFAAFFDQTPVTGEGGNAQTPPVLAVPNAYQQQQRLELETNVATIQSKIQSRFDELRRSQAEWESRLLVELDGQLDQWKQLEIETSVAQHAKLELQPDQSILATGKSPANDVYRILGKTNLETIQGLRLEALPHDSHTRGGLAKSPSANFVLTEISVRVIQQGKAPVPIEIVRAVADYEQPSHSVEFAIDDDSQSGWAVLKPIEQMSESREAVFIFADSIELPDDASLEVVLRHESIHQQHNIGRFKISLTDNEPRLLGVSSALLAAVQTDPSNRSAEQSEMIKLAMRNSDDEVLRLRRQLDAHQQKLNRLGIEVPKVMVMADMPNPRQTCLLNRGSYQEPRDEVFPNVPAMLSQIPEDAKRNRVALANWMFSESNPLTPRVTVNRMWADIFGIGLVKQQKILESKASRQAIRIYSIGWPQNIAIRVGTPNICTA